MSAHFQKPPAIVSLHGARAAYVGPALNLNPHRNAVAVVALALDAPFDLALLDEGGAGAFAAHMTALIAPGALHHLKARGPMAFLYLDALSDDHRLLSARVLASPFPLLREPIPQRRIVPFLCDRLGLPHRATPDARIAELLHNVEKDPAALTDFAAHARSIGLSTSHARELLRKSVGIPFRRYRLWRRMALVARELSAGRSLTEAAYAAGFASSAHLSTTFKAMFGLTPSAFLSFGISFDLED